MSNSNSYKSEVKELSAVECELSVMIPHSTIQLEMDKAYQRLAQQVRIKGFRQGKAPRHILEQYYRGDVEKDVLNKLLKTSYAYAINTHVLDPVAEPNIEVITPFDSKCDFSYKATVEVKPQIEVKKWQGLVVEAPIFLITDALVARELESLQERQSTILPITDRTHIAQGDLVDCNYSGTVDGSHVKSLSKMGQSIEVGSGKFFKEAEQALIQKEVGEKVEVEITFPDNFPEENFRNKTALLSIAIEGIKTRKKPALDDEFAKDVSDRFETLEDLKTAIIASLTTQKIQNEEIEKRNAAVLALLENNAFEVPKSLIERQAVFSASRVLAQMPKKQAEQIWQKIGQQLIEEAKPQALKTVQASLLCEAIAKMQNIVVSPEDIEAELEKEAQSMNVTKQRLKSHYQADDFEQLRYRLSNEKALDVVLAHAQIKSVEKPFGA